MKPTALITDRFDHALDWVMHRHHKIEEYSSGTRVIVADGIEYIVITDPEQLLGYEFAKVMVPTRHEYTHKLRDLYELAKMRVR